MTIENKDAEPYYVKKDAFSYILCKRGKGKDKKGNPKYSTHGYFPTPEGCFRKAARLLTDAKFEGEIVQGEKYFETVNNFRKLLGVEKYKNRKI